MRHSFSLFVLMFLEVHFLSTGGHASKPKQENLQAALNYMEENATEGIYRQSGRHDIEKKYLAKLKKHSFKIKKFKPIDLFALATAVKQYVLVSEFIKYELFDSCLEAAKEDISKIAGETQFGRFMVRDLLPSLETAKKPLFKQIFKHLHHLLFKSNMTKMDAMNLGIVFGPNFFPARASPDNENFRAADLAQFQTPFNEFVEKAILTYPLWDSLGKQL
ncbi:MAG: hypothetical protein KC505_07690 [Myxococcales bacterium]|nr:hypothetical protein [Myxococcales bacterium]USN50087.1 MAG: hypothetical protein H6731_07385 [Myxococcales bacterium]